MATKRFKQKDKITIYLTPALKSSIDSERKRRGGTKSEIIRRAMRSYFDRQLIDVHLADAVSCITIMKEQMAQMSVGIKKIEDEINKSRDEL